MDYFNTNGYKLAEDYYRDHPDELGTPTVTIAYDPFEETLDDYYKRTAAADTTAMKKTA